MIASPTPEGVAAAAIRGQVTAGALAEIDPGPRTR